MLSAASRQNLWHAWKVCNMVALLVLCSLSDGLVWRCDCEIWSCVPVCRCLVYIRRHVCLMVSKA